MQDKLRRYIERVHVQAYLDGLTGIGNKTAYLDGVRTLEEHIRDNTAAFSVVLFDLNGLKTINDNYGHECGDAALMDAASLLKNVFGKEHVYRIGGDEFAALLEQTDPGELRALCERLDDETERFNQTDRPYVIPLALSKGFEIFVPGRDREFKDVFRRADLALYEDKRAYYTRFGDRRRR